MKSRSLLSILVCCIFVSPHIAMGQTTYLTKQEKKDVKINAKQYAKEGWVLDGTGTLESVLTLHAIAKKNEGVTELVGNAEKKRSINMAKLIARDNVFNETAESGIKKTSIYRDYEMKVVNDEQRESLEAGSQRRAIVNIIDKAMKLSFYLYRRNPDGTYDVKALYLVNEQEMKRKLTDGQEVKSGVDK